MLHGKHKLILATALLMGEISFAQAGFIGKQFEVDYYDKDLTTPYNQSTEVPSTFSVHSGIETVVDVEGVTQVSVDFSDTSILFDFFTTLSNPAFRSETFNGLVFDVLSGGPLAFSSFSIDPSSNFAGFNENRIGLSGDRLTIDWGGLAYNTDTRVLIHFVPATVEVPEPATVTLLGLGLLGVVATRRKRLSGS